MRTVYLDNNATTPVAPEVFEAMRPFYVEAYGNPSSVHHQGTRPAAALREARRRIARFLGCKESELVFTACGTESDNLAIRGLIEHLEGKRHVVTTKVEHPAVLNVCRHLEAMGHDVTYLGVDGDGRLDLDELRGSLRDNTALVSVMFANNETGVLFPIDEIIAIAKERNIPVHVDAVQAIGKLPIDVARMGIDMLALSAHKFHGPKGTGAMVIREGLECDPLLLGGGQERGRRPGTENVAGIVAMSMACDLAAKHLDHYTKETRRLRDKFESTLLETVPDTYVHGAACPRLPNTSSMCFKGVEGQSLLVLLDDAGICASAGSACKSGAGVPSKVLAAMGVPHEDAVATLRWSLSSWTTEEDIDYALEYIPDIVARMRSKSRR